MSNNIPEGFTPMTDETELDWDSEIENDGPEFILLPDGDYNFVVLDFERGRYDGGDKIPACPKATVRLKFDTSEGSAIINHQLFLHSKTEGLLCSFFAGIGQRKKGEKLKMNWNAVPGSTGRAKIGTRDYKNKDGETITVNTIKKFYEYSDAGTQTVAKGFKRGEF